MGTPSGPVSSASKRSYLLIVTSYTLRVKLCQKIDEGFFGLVYKAELLSGGRKQDVAVKTVKRELLIVY